MGRRSSHTPQQLRALVLDAAQEIVAAKGLAGLSAREIARRIGYSAGTIYNIFVNLDDVVLNLEARVLDALDQRLGYVQEGDGADDSAPLIRVARAYLTFAQENPRLWNLLLQHHLPPRMELPHWYRQKIEALTGRVEHALAPHFTPNRDAERRRAARVLWAALHGIASLSTADKLSGVTAETAGRLLDDLIGTWLAGLASQSADGAGNEVQPPPPG